MNKEYNMGFADGFCNAIEALKTYLSKEDFLPNVITMLEIDSCKYYQDVLKESEENK